MKLNCRMDSADGPIDLSIVVPLFNEQDSVGTLLDRIARVLPGVSSRLSKLQLLGYPADVSRAEVVLVDDGSTDATYQRAVEVAAKLPVSVSVISLGRNFGQTAAMQAGIEASSGRLIATLDGDLQNDPADIPRLVTHLQLHQLDLVVGRRRHRQDGLWLRLIPSWIANRLIARATGVRLHDYGCSLKVYRAAVIRQVRLMGEMHRFIPAWVALVTDPARIGELDVQHHARRYGKSKYGLSRTFRVVLDLLSVLFFMKYRMRPGHFFGSLGLGVAGIGGGMLCMAFTSKLLYGEDIGSRPMLLLGALAMLSALQLICFGIMAEMLSRVQHESQDRPTYTVRHAFGNAAAVAQELRRSGITPAPEASDALSVREAA